LSLFFFLLLFLSLLLQGIAKIHTSLQHFYLPTLIEVHIYLTAIFLYHLRVTYLWSSFSTLELPSPSSIYLRVSSPSFLYLIHSFRQPYTIAILLTHSGL
ncbi:hypothetical protein GBAR_LOCUS6052, partial [Geodia barretti]